jgi:crotonobetainyl-CoA:carnitine CoA-transferase CaiB-like acyl-CoA transferase
VTTDTTGGVPSDPSAAPTTDRLDLPLTGVRVVDVTTGPLAAIGRYLAEWGADVVRVEPPGGGPDRNAGRRLADVSLGFVAANLGKRALGLDLTTPGDRGRFVQLVAGADILLESTLPGSPEATALDVADLRRTTPELVVLSATPFGATGSYMGWQATSAVFHALSGELSRSGLPGREPVLPPGELPYECAAPQAVLVVLLAYLQRLRTGLGDRLDFSVLDATTSALDPGYGIGGSATGGVPASKLPRGRPDVAHFYPVIPCADGFVRIALLAARQWRGMFEWMGRPEEFADPGLDKLSSRQRCRPLIPAIARFFADRTRRQLEEEAQRHGVPLSAVLDLDEAIDSEQIRARGAFEPVELAPGVTVPLPDGVLEIDGRRAGIRGPVPGIDPAGVPGTGPTWTGARVTAPLDAAGEPMARPLDGLRVLDLGVIVVGAEHGRLLGDHGADVVKVENEAFPDGSRQGAKAGNMSVGFASGHRNKRSLGLDLRSPGGKDLFLRLVADTDVVLTNFRPGTLESLGLGYETLQEVNPGVVVVDSSAFGRSGPWSRRLGYGPLVRAAAGMTSLWRYPDDSTGFCDGMTVYPDHVAARVGAAAVVALLVRRLRTGTGGTVSISQAEVMLAHLAPLVAERVLERDGAALEGPVELDAPWGVFPAAGDDDWCVVTVRHDTDWQALCRVVGRPDLAGDGTLATPAGRVAARDRVDAALREWLVERSAGEAMELLQAAGVPAGAMLRVSELPRFGYYAERGFFRVSGHPALEVELLLENASVHAERLPDPPDRPAPLVGEHTEEVVRERLGLSSAELDTLTRANVLQPATSAERTT